MRRRQQKNAPLQMLEPHGETRSHAESKIHRRCKHLCSMGDEARRQCRAVGREILLHVKRLSRVAKTGPRRTLTSCDFVETNRRQNRGAFFSCGKNRLFRGGCVAARKTRLPRISGKISADLPHGGKVGTGGRTRRPPVHCYAHGPPRRISAIHPLHADTSDVTCQPQADFVLKLPLIAG
jgi:hypothetical protein